MVRQEAARKEAESADLMAAALQVKAGQTVEAKKSARNPALEKVKLCGHVELLMAKVQTLQGDMTVNNAIAVERCQVLATEGIADAVNSAKNDLKAQLEETTKLLKAAGDKLQTLLANDIKGMTNLAELDQARKVADDLFASTKPDQRSFNLCLGSFKKMLSAVERERKLRKGAAEAVRAPEPAPPLFTILKAIVDASDREPSTSLFEAKHGVTGVLMTPEASFHTLHIVFEFRHLRYWTVFLYDFGAI